MFSYVGESKEIVESGPVKKEKGVQKKNYLHEGERYMASDLAG